MILLETSSVELFIILHSSSIALMQECQDNILMKLSAVSIKTAAETNARALRGENTKIGSSYLLHATLYKHPDHIFRQRQCSPELTRETKMLDNLTGN